MRPVRERTHVTGSGWPLAVAIALLLTNLSTVTAHAATNESWRDEFTLGGTWNGSDGTQPWSGPWSEVGDDLSPSSGLVTVTNNPSCPDPRCALLDGAAGPALPLALERVADLSGASAATVTFDWARLLIVNPGAEFRVRASSTGGPPWTTIWSVPLDQTDASADTSTIDVSGYISPTTAIRFEIAVGASDSKVFFDNVEIVATFGANQPPVFSQDLTDRTDSESDVISISAGATDPDTGQTLTYKADGLPSGVAIDAATGLISGTIDYDAAGSSPYAVTITVSDNGVPTLDDTDTFTWTVDNTNRDPVGNTEAYVTDVDTVLSVPAPGVLGNDYDPDGEPLTLTLESQPSDGIVALVPDGSFVYTPPLGFVGTTSFEYAIEDPWNSKVKVDVTITVDTNATTAGLYLSSTVVDPDTFELTPVPPSSTVLGDFEPDGDPGLTMLEGTGDINEPDPPRFHWWDLVMTDDLELLGPAAVDIYAAVTGFALGEHAHVEAWLLDCDASGTTCTDIASQDLHRDPWDTGTPTFDEHRLELGHVSHAFVTGRILRLMLQSDKQDMWFAFDTVDQPARLVLTVANGDPIIVDPPDQVAAEGTPFSLTVAASDPDGNPISWTAAGLPGWMTLTDNGDDTATLAGTPGFEDAGSTALTLTASDGTAIDTTGFTVTVDDVNRAPTVLDPGDQSDAEGDAVLVTVSASDPDAGQSLTFSATGLPPGLAIGSGSGVISGTIAAGAATGSPYGVTIQVVDDGVPALSDAVSLAWSVAPPPPAPTTTTTIPATTTTLPPTTTTTTTTAASTTTTTAPAATTTTVPVPTSTAPTTTTTLAGTPPTTTTTVVPASETPAPPPAPPSAEATAERTGALVAGDLAVSAEGATNNGSDGRTIGPAQGLVVAFRSTVEALSADLLSSLALGLVIAWLAVGGLDRRRTDEDEVAAA